MLFRSEKRVNWIALAAFAVLTAAWAGIQAAPDTISWNIGGPAGYRTLCFMPPAGETPGPDAGLIVVDDAGSQSKILIDPSGLVGTKDGKIGGKVKMSLRDGNGVVTPLGDVEVKGIAFSQLWITDKVDLVYANPKDLESTPTTKLEQIRKVKVFVSFAGRAKNVPNVGTVAVAVSGIESYTEKTTGTIDSNDVMTMTSPTLMRGEKGMKTRAAAVAGKIAFGKVTKMYAAPAPIMGEIYSTAATFAAQNEKKIKWTGDAVSVEYLPTTQTLTAGGATQVATKWQSDKFKTPGRASVNSNNWKDARMRGISTALIYTTQAELEKIIADGQFSGIESLSYLPLNMIFVAGKSTYWHYFKYDKDFLYEQIRGVARAHGKGFLGIEESLGTFKGSGSGKGKCKASFVSQGATGEFTGTLQIDEWAPHPTKVGRYTAAGTLTVSGKLKSSCCGDYAFTNIVFKFKHEDGLILNPQTGKVYMKFTEKDFTGVPSGVTGTVVVRGEFNGTTLSGSVEASARWKESDTFKCEVDGSFSVDQSE